MEAAEHTGANPVDVGWTALDAAEWTVARSSFEEALARDEQPLALEGLSWAAWWLDDAQAVFEARERAYVLYRQTGDPASAARMAIWLAIDQLDFNGAMAVANGWLRRAHRLLDPLEPGPEHGWLDFQEGYLARLRGDAAEAERLGTRAAEVGGRFAVPDLEMLGLALQGATLVSRAKVEEGMRCLDEATALALEGGARVPISAAWACCFLVTACSAARDYERAFEWCDRIAQFAERYGSRYMLGFCRAEYGEVHLWRGRWIEAEALLNAAVEDFSRSRPAMAGAPLSRLAELRRRQGRRDEAEALLKRAGSSANAQLCRARIALDRDQAGRAVELCERVLRQLPGHLKLDRAPALELLVRARSARGDLDQAATPLAELNELRRLVGSASLCAHTDVAEAILAAASGEHGRARSLLEDAVDRFERSGAPYETAVARLGLATSLLAAGRAEDAQGEAAAALELFLDLGAEAGSQQARQLLSGVIRHDQRSGAPLTPREREVLGLLAEGLTNKQIAERLVVSEHTIHRHVTNILRKLDRPSRTAAAAFAVRSGLLDDPGA